MLNLQTATLKQLKTYTSENNIYVSGDKRRKESFIQSIEHHNLHNNVEPSVVIVPFLIVFLLPILLLFLTIELVIRLVKPLGRRMNNVEPPTGRIEDREVWDYIFEVV